MMQNHKTNPLQHILAEPRKIDAVNYSWLSIVIPLITLGLLCSVMISALMQAAGDWPWRD